jgi:hypothetical protein
MEGCKTIGHGHLVELWIGSGSRKSPDIDYEFDVRAV